MAVFHWSHFQGLSNSAQIVSYLCERCYVSLTPRASACFLKRPRQAIIASAHTSSAYIKCGICDRTNSATNNHSIPLSFCSHYMVCETRKLVQILTAILTAILTCDRLRFDQSSNGNLKSLSSFFLVKSQTSQSWSELIPEYETDSLSIYMLLLSPAATITCFLPWHARIPSMVPCKDRSSC